MHLSNLNPGSKMPPITSAVFYNSATTCYSISILGVELYYSYGTIMAFYTPRTAYRRADHRSVTTAKHMGLMSVSHYDQLTDEAFVRELTRAFVGGAMRYLDIYPGQPPIFPDEIPSIT
jgi:hypothetical protein